MNTKKKGALQIFLSISSILILGFVFQINNYTPPFYSWYFLVMVSFIITLNGIGKMFAKIAKGEKDE